MRILNAPLNQNVRLAYVQGIMMTRKTKKAVKRQGKRFERAEAKRDLRNY
jgi:hypothetical protein